jgi:Flp pilus assembly protein TadG
MRLINRPIKAFVRREDGVALVEFALFLPVFLLSIFVIVEFSRTFFSYQGAIAGVRDAARYAARIVDRDVCDVSGAEVDITNVFNNAVAVNGSTDALYQIVFRNMDNENRALPSNVRLISVTSRYTCEVAVGGTLNQIRVPVAEVSANFLITLPLIGLLELNGLEGIIPDATITRTIVDKSRIFGA